jgi:hypothetical protein
MALLREVAVLVVVALAAIVSPQRANCQAGVGKLDLVDNAVAEAKSQGRTVAVMPHLFVEPPMILGSIDDAVSHFSIVVGVPKSTTVQNDRFTLVTWYKVQVEELLLRQPTLSTANVSPRSSRPLGPGELWIPVSGGETEIDGVKVAQSRIPRLELGTRYALVLNLQSDGMAGMLIAQEWGVFRVGPKLELTPMLAVGPAGGLYRDMTSKGITTLDTLRTFLQQRHP